MTRLFQVLYVYFENVSYKSVLKRHAERVGLSVVASRYDVQCSKQPVWMPWSRNWYLLREMTSVIKLLKGHTQNTSS